MKHLLRKILVTFLICIPIAEVLISPMLLKAANAGDPAITDFVIYPTKPAPKSEVDFLVTFSNYGAMLSNNVTLVVDFEENIFKQILVGDPDRCANTGVTVVCNIPSLDPGAEESIGFTGLVTDSAKLGEKVISYAVIDEPGNPDDVKQNNFKDVTIEIGNEVKPSMTGIAGTPTADLLKDQKILDEPSGKQNVAILDVQNNPNWETSGLFTAGLKFMIRGKEALAWALGIKDSGFHNPAIQENYLKVLTVVNSLFIVGLLAIAAMWMFSILIPRRYLRQVILVYGIAVIFVNFALPLNQLLIDGTGLLQKTFMSGLSITNIVETPNYNDKVTVGYQNKSGLVTNTENRNLDFSITNQEADSGTDNVTIGKIQQDFLNPSYTGTINTQAGDEETLQLRSTGTDVNLMLNKNQSIQIADQKVFNPDQENLIFAFLMLLFTGLAYFGMALIFILRIVILWGLMIISPVLFLLGIFRLTRSYFVNWLGVYAHWLLVGPLMALGIAIVVNIWKATGLPITSGYMGTGDFGMLTNIGFYLPGSASVNTLSNTQQMMEYMLFLVMLYLPIIFAFMLTKQKLLSSAVTTIIEKAANIRGTKSLQTASATETIKKEQTTTQTKSLIGGVTGFLGTQFSKFTKAAMPENLKTNASGQTRVIESATSLLPEHLAISSVHDMLNLTAGNAKDSRKSREKAIEYLAAPDEITDKTEHQKVVAVRQEINKRVQAGDTEAIRVMDEIHEREKAVVAPIVAPMVAPVVELIIGKKDLKEKTKSEETVVHNELMDEEKIDEEKLEKSEKNKLAKERKTRHK